MSVERAGDGEPAELDRLEGGDDPPRRGAGLLRGAALGLLLVVSACFGGGIASFVFLTRPPPAPAPTEIVEARPAPDVVMAVRDLARLETASFHIERVVEVTSRQQQLFGLLEAEDALLLVAAGDVVAGVDLTEMQDGDVTLEPATSTATLRLPPVRVLSSHLDNELTYVHQRRTDMLAERRDELETEARREAESTLARAALRAGILERAERNAGRTIETLVRSLGWDHVVIEHTPAPDDPRAEGRLGRNGRFGDEK
jgi:hypothetical protein